MFLSGSFLGISVFRKLEDIPIRRKYNKVRIYGSSTIDKLQILNKELTNTEIQNINTTDALKWNVNTLALSEFEGNLVAGNIANSDPIIKWQVTRREQYSDTLKILDTIDVSRINYIDYTCQQNKDYIYDIFPLTESQIGIQLESEVINTNFYGWYLVGNDADGTTFVYHLDLNLQFGGYTTEEDYVEYKTYGQYNAFAKGKRKFRRGTIEAIAGSISSDGGLLQSIDYIKDLENRIQDISTKILKSRKGEIMKVKTHGFSAVPVENGISSQPYVCKFEFVECEEMT